MEKLDWSNFTKAKYGALGYCIGGLAQEKNVVINGMPDIVNFDDMKHLLSSPAVSGTTALCHIVGVTPEAPTLEEALGHRKAEEEIIVGEKEIDETWDKLSTASSSEVDIVCLGCPHCSIQELREIALLLKDKKVTDSVSLWIATSEQTCALARLMGYVDIIEKAGGVLTDTCLGAMGVIGSLMGAKVIATNSARAAYFIALSSEIIYGTVKDCLDSAITGNWRA